MPMRIVRRLQTYVLKNLAISIALIHRISFCSGPEYPPFHFGWTLMELNKENLSQMTQVFLVERSIELSNLIWEGLGELEFIP